MLAKDGRRGRVPLKIPRPRLLMNKRDQEVELQVPRRTIPAAERLEWWLGMTNWALSRWLGFASGGQSLACSFVACLALRGKFGARDDKAKICDFDWGISPVQGYTAIRCVRTCGVTLCPPASRAMT